MTLPASGQISLNQIHVEAGGSTGSQVKVSDTDVKAIINANNSNTAFSDYYGVSASAPSATFIQRRETSGNGFPNGSITLPSGSNKLIVGCMELAGIQGITQNTGVSLGGTAMTLAIRNHDLHPVSTVAQFKWQTAIYYIQTSLSGSVSIAGTGGSGRSTMSFYQITGHNSITPYTSVKAQNTNSDNVASITVNEQYNGLTILTAVSYDGTITWSNTDTLSNRQLESATSHVSATNANASAGNTTYTYTNTTDTSAQTITMCAASWK